MHHLLHIDTLLIIYVVTLCVIKHRAKTISLVSQKAFKSDETRNFIVESAFNKLINSPKRIEIERTFTASHIVIKAELT